MDDWYTEYDMEVSVGAARESLKQIAEYWAAIEPAVAAATHQAVTAMMDINLEMGRWAEQAVQDIREAFSGWNFDHLL